ncbi:MAG: hypothetical protein CUN52_09880 [Phototrophicales bacterium]|nr:MAG: hypothetical protein CUN52_09880 [Phototrophicales bacterium]
MQLFTIGFTQKSAEQFFNLLKHHQVNVLIDTRLKPDSQLSGFAKGRDLPYFLRHLIGCDYIHNPLMSPTEAILTAYRDNKDWDAYEIQFRELLAERELIKHLDKTWFMEHRACLLCSEHEPDHCHRRLVAEYIQSFWGETEIWHLM